MPFFVEFNRPSTDAMFTISGYGSISTPVADNKAEVAAIVSPEHAFDISEFDTTGWTCFYCGHSVNECSFVQCGRCKALVCGSRIRALPDGRLEFHCHTGCGCVGIVSDTLTSLSGAAHETHQEHTHIRPNYEKANLNLKSILEAAQGGGDSLEAQVDAGMAEYRRLVNSPKQNDKA